MDSQNKIVLWTIGFSLLGAVIQEGLKDGGSEEWVQRNAYAGPRPPSTWQPLYTYLRTTAGTFIRLKLWVKTAWYLKFAPWVWPLTQEIARNESQYLPVEPSLPRRSESRDR